MRRNAVDVFIIPHSDPHIGENIPDHWKIIPWLTGFIGSAATVVITDSFAGMWTDSRYFLQAEKELKGSGFTLMKPELPALPDHLAWLQANMEPGRTAGLDGRIFPVTAFRKLQEKLRGKNIKFITDFDPISEIWTGRQPMPFSMVRDHQVAFAGKERSWKISKLREEMGRKGEDLCLLTSPDDIMWLLNIRGGDLPFNPVCYSYALAGALQILLFVEEKKVPGHIAAEFDRFGIVILPYPETEGMLSKITDAGTILIDPAGTNLSLYNSIATRLKIIEDISPVLHMRAIKNPVEISNISLTMIMDGVALTRFFKWIDENRGLVPMTELSLSVRLHEMRAQHEEFVGPSFQTIMAYNEHAALPHYSASGESDATIGEKGILLVDSGGHYSGGTTDITRTITLGSPTPQQRKDFTLVLKGHIALANARFPIGTRGYQIDMLARKPLWDNGLNYGHGTGHGVGYCLSVHEGPQSVSPAGNRTAIEPGMLLSNEPAVYREGEYGIRTENLIICYEDEETEFGTFLKFDTVSLCYIDKNLIDRSLLNEEEISWINSYHSEVYEKLAKDLTVEERSWLREKTEPL
ncbi:MAG: aminopeptidase P family protein [Bacteroidales bacterium]|nr:aminopeptidase P family protein [Bacteroidales bacterium]